MRRKPVWDCEAAGFTFGVEFELTYPESLDYNGTFYGDSEDGIGPGFPDGWFRKDDGSLRSGRGRYTAEVIGPIMQGRDDLQEVKEVAKSLYQHGCRVNSSCGFHVHVGYSPVIGTLADDSSGLIEWLRRLLTLVCFHEKGLFATTGARSRLDNHFCQSNREHWSGAISWLKRESYLSYSKVNFFRNTTSRIGRYLLLNTTNIESNRKQTVEFRVWPGTLNPLKAEAYIQLALGLCQKAACEVNSGATPWQAKYDPSSKFYAPEVSWAKEANKLIRALGWRKGGRQYGRLFPIQGRIDQDRSTVLIRQMARKLDSEGSIPNLSSTMY